MTTPKFQDGTESAVLCPTCNPPRKLIVRSNKHTGSQFLGCPNYPVCDHTQAIPESWIMRAQGQPDLFSTSKEHS